MSGSQQLPFLPGYSVAVDKRDRFHKAHYFDVSSNGTRIDHSQSLAVNAQAAVAYANANPNHPLAVAPSASLTTYNTAHTSPAFHTSPSPSSLTSPPNPSSSSTLSSLPAWVAYDRKVLRFYGYFKEAVHSSPIETWRVRRCVLYLYLEDESLHIAEPKIENSGIPQGVFVKRHRIPKPDSNMLYGVDDLRVGVDMLVYGRAIRLIDADAFTRDFYAKHGTVLAAAEEYPLDAFAVKSAPSSVSTHKLMHPHKLYMEASLGKPMLPSASATQQFLTLDGHVLRFYASWDDDKMYGEKKPYILHYYLADDTIEVNEVQTANNGRDPFPTLLKRGRLPKDWQSGIPNVAKLGTSHTELTSAYYSLLDLRIGNTVNVYGRLLTLCSMDAYTRQYYAANFGMQDDDFTPIHMTDVETELAQLTPPPYNGYGSEEDSLGSFLFLVPKVPKINYQRLSDYDGVHLRYLAQLHPATASKVDRDRRFILTLYVATQQISIFERLERNSGFLGGKFLERSKLKNPATGKSYEWKEFRGGIGGGGGGGARVRVNEYEFEVLEADEYTRKWMEKEEKREQGQGNTKAEEEKTQL